MVLAYARECGSNAKAWREFNVPKSTFYFWKKAFDREGKNGDSILSSGYQPDEHH
ncbi:helix-turn-helix domain-containing protein [Candidatus Neomarinimicrobiota bacterium]